MDLTDVRVDAACLRERDMPAGILGTLLCEVPFGVCSRSERDVAECVLVIRLSGAPFGVARSAEWDVAEGFLAIASVWFRSAFGCVSGARDSV